MHGVSNENRFLIKIKGWTWGPVANYDIYDPETGHITMECREKRLGIVTKIFRCIDCHRMTPFDIQVRIPYRHQVVRVTKGISVILSRSEMNVLDENDRRIGGWAPDPLFLKLTNQQRFIIPWRWLGKMLFGG